MSGLSNLLRHTQSQTNPFLLIGDIVYFLIPISMRFQIEIGDMLHSVQNRSHVIGRVIDNVIQYF